MRTAIPINLAAVDVYAHVCVQVPHRELCIDHALKNLTAPTLEHHVLKEARTLQVKHATSCEMDAGKVARIGV